MARSAEVIVVDRPEHDSSQPILRHVFSFLTSDFLVVVAYPLVALVSVRSHSVWIGLHNSPLGVIFYGCANFIIRQVALFAGGISLLPRTVRRGTNLGGVRIVKGVRATICGNSQNKLVPICTGIQVKLDAVVLWG